MALEYVIQQIPPATVVVTLTGPLTLGTNLKTVDNQLQGLIAQGTKILVLDLTAVPYIDSAGLGTIVHSMGLLQHRACSLRLCGVNERIGAILRMTHTDQLFPIDADVAASLANPCP